MNPETSANTSAPAPAGRVFDGIDEFRSAVGEELGLGEWYEITQEQVNAFADVTEDWQWIHVDIERSQAGPYGATVAHGYLTLALIPRLGGGIFRVSGPRMAVNYGTNKVRFPHPVTVGSRIRARATLAEVTDVPAGVQAVVRYTIEIDGQDKPACVAETVRVLVM
ncbi:MaoC family dehydratase [Nocardioides sp. YIM 152315]|uniref:MaoC family dehydratase n=1 Tax=Nocardioides sp. YIM 152315 TaxID=3031760 RepID=UPI0023DA804E|nr:MaoC family dehydratase [Nocardioides sp. YIM 152315]MDF1602248.1 MaoC family dehydratase [Nocardioides sp. YIM 152315]